MLPDQRSDDHHVTSHLSSHGKETMVMGEVKWGLRACLRVGPGESALTVTLYGRICWASILVKWFTPALRPRPNTRDQTTTRSWQAATD